MSLIPTVPRMCSGQKRPGMLAVAMVLAISAPSALAAPSNAPSAASGDARKPLTPAQMVALPDGGAPPPPDGYTTIDDTTTSLYSYSNVVRRRENPDLPGNEAHQSTNIPNDAPSHFSIFGIPVKFNAPVRPSYTNGVYHTYMGAPGNGVTDLNEQADPGHP
ncbi:hypothetical protein [Brytella acorum]|uniref:Uncharacterized protein n=1 Tax=Brytella acorum TaxID=2959299 RepID=A0AA35Y1L1_9PROT|nr:hypothetical protein [Brytella acorum]MDF3623822.1 hypothetical protein [Brytella acorum]CAI9120737.1 hypothetical protein LMG32879_001575 [Brytella acorum]